MKRLFSLQGSFGEWLSSLLPQASSSSTLREPPSSVETLDELKDTMEKIHKALEDTEEKHMNDKSEQLHLSELKDVAYDAEDAMDEYEYEVLRAKVEARRQAMTCNMLDGQHANEVISDWKFYHPEVSISDELTFRVKEIRRRFESITDNWDRISLKSEKRRCVRKWKPQETAACFNRNETFGREAEKMKIIEWLVQGGNEPNGCRVQVLSLVGMGGLGKTTLAQMVYNNPRVCRHFSVKGWICVSEDFDNLDSLTKRICASFRLTVDDNMSLDMILEALQKKMNGKRFFLVLDNLWNQSFEAWNSLKSLLVNAGVGKILVTTRSEHVAKIMQTTPPIKLCILSFDNCWSLFSKIAFETRDRELHLNLLDIGKKIVGKCAGLPLAVKVLASFLRFEDDEEAWVEILISELWELDKEQCEILPALRLTYDHMPMELRPCYMYLSLFPKDYKLERLTIVQQWMPHGFLRPSEEKKEEDIGNDYFDELLHRSILQYVEFNHRFAMHDLIHDLAQDVARAEYLLISVDKLDQTIPKTIRHLSVIIRENFEIKELKLLFESKLHLRTLLLHSVKRYPINNLMPNLMHNLMSLRTFSLVHLYREIHEKSPIYEIINLDFFGTLKHLRYLGLSVYADTNINTSKSLYKLYHLQTLNLDDQVTDLVSEGVGDLVNLRHFSAYPLSALPQEVVGLTNLETMKEFVVGAETSQLKLSHLKDLVNLREQLRVRGLNNVHPSDFTPSDAFMKTRTEISDLELCWHEYKGQYDDDDDDDDKIVCDENLAEQVLDYLRPHPDIKGFGINRYPTTIMPIWLGSLSKLETLTLEQCRLTSLPTLGQLPSLKVLHIRRLNRVKKVGREFLCPLIADAKRSCFLLLEKLEFEEMVEWEEWEGVEDVDFPRLQELVLMACPNLRRLPLLPSLDSLTVWACPQLRLTSLPSLTNLELVQEWSLDVISCCYTPMLQFLNISFYLSYSLAFPANQVLYSLPRLAIGPCSELTSITGLGKFTNLQRLMISECPKLQISPDELLPPNLQVVKIIESPGAEKWYQHQVLNGKRTPY